MRKRYDEQLKSVNEDLIHMGNLVEGSIEAAITALIEQNTELAQSVVRGDAEINEMEKEIESKALKLLLRQQPVASDFRFVSSALKIITDMERIGDAAQDIAEITIRLSEETYTRELVHIPQMAKEVINMVKNSIDAFVNKDLDLVEKVIQNDDKVDELFDIIKKELMDIIRNDIDSSEQAVDLLLITKYLERTGDHAQNIAEWVYYAITSEQYSGPK